MRFIPRLLVLCFLSCSLTSCHIYSSSNPRRKSPTLIHTHHNCAPKNLKCNSDRFCMWEDCDESLIFGTIEGGAVND